MKIIKDKISLKELKKMAQKMFGNLVKAVVDIKKEIMAIDGEMHADEEALLLEKGSKQTDLWGINLFPGDIKNFIEYDSIINLRPAQGNRSRGVDDAKIRQRIIKIVNRLVQK